MTQQQLAKAARIQQSMISQIESGVRRGRMMSVEAAARIALALSVSLDALIGLPLDEEKSETECDSETFAAVAS